MWASRRAFQTRVGKSKGHEACYLRGVAATVRKAVWPDGRERRERDRRRGQKQMGRTTPCCGCAVREVGAGELRDLICVLTECLAAMIRTGCQREAGRRCRRR